MPHRCELGCKNKDVHLHVFPNPNKFPDRFREWVNLIGGKLNSPSDYEFYKKKRICDIHFTDEHRNRFKRLNALAIPTLHLPMRMKPEAVFVKEIKEESMHGEKCLASEPVDKVYQNHIVKNELVLGPVCLQPPDAVLALRMRMKQEAVFVKEIKEESLHGEKFLVSIISVGSIIPAWQNQAKDKVAWKDM